MTWVQTKLLAKLGHILLRQTFLPRNKIDFGFWFVTEVTEKCRRAPVLKLCQSPLPSHCCNSGIIHGHQS